MNEYDWSGLRFHHSRALQHCRFGTVEQDPSTDAELDEKVYSWVEKVVNFYPIFMAIGETEVDLRMTSYQYQWNRRYPLEYRNQVLFSYTDIKGGIYTDYNCWQSVYNLLNDYPVSEYEKKLIFKSSWRRSDWLRKSKRDPCSVQLLVSSLNLGAADLISVRNQATRRILEKMGFQNVEVRRFK